MEVERPEWLAQMEAVLETLNQGVIVRDDCHRVIFANQCFLDLVGQSSEQVVGKAPKDFFPPEEAARLMEFVAMSEQSGHGRFEFYLPRSNGERVPVIITGRVFEDPDGREFAVVSMTDISDQKRVEHELKKAHGELQERYREIEEELVLAARVQQSLAPKGLRWGGIEVSAYYHPVRRIGGDFGLVSPAGSDHLNLVVCDVSGHGIGSALVANRIYTETISLLERGVPVQDALRHLNRFVMQDLAGSVLFFTMAAARIDSARKMTFAGGGHPPAILMQPGARPRQLESRSLVLGLLDQAVNSNAAIEVPLERGDRLALYTDGFTDVFSDSGEFLGVDGLQEILFQASKKPFPGMKQEVLDKVAAFRNGPPADDMSLVLLEVT